MSSVTIRDVAERAGVSISTVHQALNGKKGVSEENRQRISEIAAALGYQPNPMASSLKRKTRHIGILLPDSSYYDPVWKGVREYLESVPNMNIRFTEMPIDDDTTARKTLEIIEGQSIDGILVTGHSDLFGSNDWDRLLQSNVAVALVGADAPDSHRMFCVLPDYEIIGRTMAELILSHIPSFGSVALCAGNPGWEPHAMVVDGFEAYMRELGAGNRIYRDNSWDESEASYAGIVEMLSQPDVAACCSVLSQSSVLLGRALRQTRKAGQVFAVGSDLSEESAACLRQGVFHNVIEKNPYAQGYLGAKNLAEYLMLGRQPEPDKVYVGSAVVFNSNLPMYQDDRYCSLFR